MFGVLAVLAEGKVLSRHIDLFDYIDRKSSVAKLNVGSGSRNHTTAYYMRGRSDTGPAQGAVTTRRLGRHGTGLGEP